MKNTLTFIVPDEYDRSPAQTFLRRYCRLSARMITKLKRSPYGILMDGKTLRTVDFVFSGKQVIITLPDENSGIFPVKGTLDIVYEDRHLLVVNKPPNMPVHPVKQHQCDTLANIVADYSESRGESYIFRAVNRLDRNTSGLVIVAKNGYSVNELKHNVYKKYFALCHGKIENEGVINSPIALADNSIMLRTVSPHGQHAVTHYKPIIYNEDFSFVSLWLETGRTHQIRCHMSSIGHPLLGDDLYGGETSLISRQALHCGEIEFVHPEEKKLIKLSADLPEDMKSIIEKHLPQ